MLQSINNKIQELDAHIKSGKSMYKKGTLVYNTAVACILQTGIPQSTGKYYGRGKWAKKTQWGEGVRRLLAAVNVMAHQYNDAPRGGASGDKIVVQNFDWPITWEQMTFEQQQQTANEMFNINKHFGYPTEDLWQRKMDLVNDLFLGYSPDGDFKFFVREGQIIIKFVIK